ncbi:DUF927 domain-containing protein [Muricoccus radiodurans]|uniref:DUF927 domain-containing protein n=1 Tax=Muricoccus radiodurans TaxID=2231721 RepID=UPI003CF90BD6
MRCETPFRASVSEAAFIRIGPDGNPFLHDVGTGTTYHLARDVGAGGDDDAADDEDQDEADGAEDVGPPLSAEEEIERLACLSRLAYQSERKAAAQRLGLTLAAVDAEVKRCRTERRRDDAENARKMPPPKPGEVRWPFGFSMRPDGLHVDAGEEGMVWLAAPFEVLGEARDAAGEGWSLWLRWKDRDGRPHTWPMPARLLVTQPGELEAALLERGLRLSPHPGARLHLREALSGVQAGSRVTLVSRAGWHAHSAEDAAFVLPDGSVVGEVTEKLVMRAPPENAAQMVAVAGTLEVWKTQVAALAVGNPLAVFCVAAAFAGPLLDPCGEPSGGFHIVGRSKVGKTAALRMAASVWGPPVKGAMLRDWRGTTNSAEAAAEEHGDGLLLLDEVHQADPREVASAAYMFANESGKGRLRRDTTAQRRRTWRCFVLSSGEVDIATTVAKAGQTLPAGAEVRLPSISVDAVGAWPQQHGRASSEALMADLHGAVRREHGTACRAFIARLGQVRRDDPSGLELAASAMRARMAQCLPADADPQVKDVARRCALVALAGELAREWGVLPWPEDEAFRAARAMLLRWIEKRGGGGATEEAQHVRAVRLFLTQHGASRFVALHFSSMQEERGWVESHPDRPVINRAGWRRRLTDGRDEYLIAPEAWRELCQDAGVDPVEAGRTLKAQGFITAGDEKNLARKESIPGVGRARVYVVAPDLLGEAPMTARRAA